jgi:hypothetical protein
MSSNTPLASSAALSGMGGTGGPGSGYGGLAGSGVNAGYTRTAHDVEEQNDERLEGLLGKVKILKDVSGSALLLRRVGALGPEEWV